MTGLLDVSDQIHYEADEIAASEELWPGLAAKLGCALCTTAILVSHVFRIQVCKAERPSRWNIAMR